jgi:hypothetical protein
MRRRIYDEVRMLDCEFAAATQHATVGSQQKDQAFAFVHGHVSIVAWRLSDPAQAPIVVYFTAATTSADTVHVDPFLQLLRRLRIFSGVIQGCSQELGCGIAGDQTTIVIFI